MKCLECGREFTPNAKSQKFCSRHCGVINKNKNYAQRDEPPEPLNGRPIAEFICKNCGKSVFIYTRHDQRSSYCCGKCATKYKNKMSQLHNIKKRGDNIGISSAMSLGNLIRRERRDLD